MAYFANGTEGAEYEQKWCARCAHYEGCAVLDAHFAKNYEECNNKDSILHMLIPQDGLTNKRCRMFLDEAYLSPLAREKFRYEARNHD